MSIRFFAPMLASLFIVPYLHADNGEFTIVAFRLRSRAVFQWVRLARCCGGPASGPHQGRSAM